MLGKVGLFMLSTNKTTIPGNAALLGYSGVITFAAAAGLIALGTDDMRPAALDAFLVYAAVILVGMKKMPKAIKHEQRVFHVDK